MKLIYLHDTQLSSSGFTFVAGESYEVPEDIAAYLKATFTGRFKEETPVEEPKEVVTSTKKATRAKASTK